MREKTSRFAGVFTAEAVTLNDALHEQEAILHQPDFQLMLFI